MIWSVSLLFSHGCKFPLQFGYVLEFPFTAPKTELCAYVRVDVDGWWHFKPGLWATGLNVVDALSYHYARQITVGWPARGPIRRS